MRTPDRLAQAKLHVHLTWQPRIKRLRMQLWERSAPAKLVPMSQAPFRFARASFAPARLDETRRAANRLAPERSARLKSILLRSRSERSLPDRSAGLSRSALASSSRTWSVVRSAACDKGTTPAATTR